MLFLMLTSIIISTFKDMLKDSSTKLSSCWIHSLKLLFLFFLNKWKEKQLGKMLITLLPEENSEWRGLNKENTLLNLLSILTNGLLISSCWHLVSEASENEWWPNNEPVLDSMRDYRI